VILRRRADHCRPANVDILDAFVEAGAARDRLLEGIEIDDQEINRLDPVGIHRRLVLRIVADGEQAAMHLRVQGLDAPVHHLGKAGELGNILHREARLGEHAPRAAGRDEIDAARAQRAGEIDEPRLVGYGQKRARNAAEIKRHQALFKGGRARLA